MSQIRNILPNYKAMWMTTDNPNLAWLVFVVLYSCHTYSTNKARQLLGLRKEIGDFERNYI